MPKTSKPLSESLVCENFRLMIRKDGVEDQPSKELIEGIAKASGLSFAKVERLYEEIFEEITGEGVSLNYPVLGGMG